MKYKMASVVTSVVQIVFEISQKTFLPKKNMLTSNPTREDKTNSNMWQRARVNVEDGPTQAEATAAKYLLCRNGKRVCLCQAVWRNVSRQNKPDGLCAIFFYFW